MKTTIELPSYENYYLSQKDGKTITPIPSEVYFDDGAKLTFCGRKEKGWSVGGWYKTEGGSKVFD
jgi:hypothetical protein